MKKIWVLALACSSPVFAAEKSEPRPEHLSASHTEGKGLGYSIGYSSLDLFLSQPFSCKKMVPFLDLRGHVFNNGEYAANAGLGFRYLSTSWKQVWGVNAFYDYLQTTRRPYNQVGMGLEVLGKNWDVRLNGYLPVGGKTKNIYRFEYGDFGSESLEGDSSLGLGAIKLPGFRLKAREQFAMRGIDSLIGYRFCKNRHFEARVGAGPYYYYGTSAKTTNAFGKRHAHALGGCLKAGLSFMNYFFLEGVAAYDSLFKWTGQGTITLSLPFDFTWKFKQLKCSDTSYCLKARLYQPVLRNEIVVVDSTNRYSSNPKVLDPDFKP